VAALVDSEGKPHFNYIVEGCKVVPFKDSSANKGGAMSSLLEVLAGLVLSTEEYVDLILLYTLPDRLLFPPSKPTTR